MLQGCAIRFPRWSLPFLRSIWKCCSNWSTHTVRESIIIPTCNSACLGYHQESRLDRLSDDCLLAWPNLHCKTLGLSPWMLSLKPKWVASFFLSRIPGCSFGGGLTPLEEWYKWWCLFHRHHSSHQLASDCMNLRQRCGMKSWSLSPTINTPTIFQTIILSSSRRPVVDSTIPNTQKDGNQGLVIRRHSTACAKRMRMESAHSPLHPLPTLARTPLSPLEEFKRTCGVTPNIPLRLQRLVFPGIIHSRRHVHLRNKPGWGRGRWRATTRYAKCMAVVEAQSPGCMLIFGSACTSMFVIFHLP